ncbi:MAG: hypothetical protein ACI9LY_001441 [Arenicella sp.]|jgi:hypothetical protein
MTQFLTKHYTPTEGVNVHIADGDKVLTLDYQGSMTKHKSSLWWGTAVGYRAMQMAAKALSDEVLWSRENLVLVSGHPGPGVLDSLNYVTGCVDANTCTVMENENCTGRCNSEMTFEWWVSDGEKTAHIALREDFVPIEFYQLIDRRVYHENTEEDDRIFELFKVNLSTRLWVAALEENFSVDYIDPLAVGEIPTQHKWNLVAEQ